MPTKKATAKTTITATPGRVVQRPPPKPVRGQYATPRDQLPRAEPPETRSMMNLATVTKLKAHYLEGVFKHPRQPGVFVDRTGKVLSLAELMAYDKGHFEQLKGGPIDTPVDMMEALSKDPRQPLDLRMDMANKAAPYRTPKLTAVQMSGTGGGPIQYEDIAKMTPAELQAEWEALQIALKRTSGGSEG